MAANWRDELPEVARALSAYQHDLRKLSDGVENGIYELGRGNPHGACEVIALTHYAVGRLPEQRRKVLEAFREAGINPGEQHEES